MATTTIQADLDENASPVKAYLDEAESSLVAPASGGYVLTLSPTESGLYTFSVTEALVGVYRVTIQDGDAVTVAQGYVWIEADDTSTYICTSDFNTAMMRKELATVDSNVDAILVDTGTTLPATLATISQDTGTDIPASITELSNDIATVDACVDAIKAKTDLLGAPSATFPGSSPVRVNITRNDAYDGTANAVISFTVAKDYTSGFTGTFTVRHHITGDSLISKAVTVTDATTLTVSLDSADTALTALTTDADFGPHPFDIEMVSGSSKITATNGIAILEKDETF